MKTATAVIATACLLTLYARAGAGEAQDRLHRDALGAARGARHAAAQRLHARRSRMLGGKLGGREVEVIVQDDELKPDVAVNKVKALRRARQGRLRRRPDLLQHPAGDHEARDRRRRDPDLARTPAPRTSPARTATRTSSSPRTRTTRTTRCSASTRRTRGSRRRSSWRRTTRRARTRSPASSATSRARWSTRSTCRSTSSTIRPSSPRSRRPRRKRSSCSCRAAWA